MGSVPSGVTVLGVLLVGGIPPGGDSYCLRCSQEQAVTVPGVPGVGVRVQGIRHKMLPFPVPPYRYTPSYLYPGNDREARRELPLQVRAPGRGGWYKDPYSTSVLPVPDGGVFPVRVNQLYRYQPREYSSGMAVSIRWNFPCTSCKGIPVPLGVGIPGRVGAGTEGRPGSTVAQSLCL